MLQELASLPLPAPAACVSSPRRQHLKIGSPVSKNQRFNEHSELTILINQLMNQFFLSGFSGFLPEKKNSSIVV